MQAFEKLGNMREVLNTGCLMFAYSEKFLRLIKDKQKVIDAQSSAIQQLESQIKAI